MGGGGGEGWGTGEKSIQADRVKAYNAACANRRYMLGVQPPVARYPQLRGSTFQKKVRHLAEPARLATSNRLACELPTTSELAADPTG